MTGERGLPTPSVESEVDLAQLGPATRLAIRVGLQALDVSIRLYEEKQTFRTLATDELRELSDLRNARRVLLTQDYPPPYKAGASHAPSVDPPV